MRPWTPTLLAALALLSLAGCSGNVRVTGQLVEDGQPYALPPGESLEVHLLSTDPAMYPPRDFLKMVDPDGRFTADQGDGSGRGLPPGRYKVKLRSETPAVKTKLQGKPELTAEFEAARGAPVHLTIDLGKRTITW
jgi:hypothetical protein